MHSRFKHQTFATVTIGVVRALVLLMILVAYLAADAEIVTLFEPFFLFLFLVFRVEARTNVHFHCVVSRGECFNIPVEIAILLLLRRVIDIVNHKKSCKDSPTGNDQAQLSPERDLLF